MQSIPQLGDQLSTVNLLTSDGEATTLQDYFGHPLIVATPRYYG